MKHFWTAAAVTALIGLGATEADAAARHKKHTPDTSAKAEQDSDKPAATGRHSRTTLRGRKAADEDAQPATSRRGRSRSKAKAEDADQTDSRHSRRGRKDEDVATSDKDSGSDARGHGRAAKAASTRGGRREAADEEGRGGDRGVIHTEAPAPVTVGKGDTLYALSRKTGVDRETIAKLNGLKPPYHLRPGQDIKLPSRRYYAIGKGETITAAAKKLGTDPVALAAFNETDLNGRVRAGQKLYVPEEVREPEAAPVKQAASHKPTAAERRARERTTEVAQAEEAPARTSASRRSSATTARRSATEPRPAVTTPPPARLAEARPFRPQPPIGQTAPQPRVTPPGDGLDAATGLPADGGSTAAPLSAPPATVAVQTAPPPRPPVQTITRAPVTTRPSNAAPARVAPSYQTQAQTQAPAAQAYQAPPSSGFQMAPPAQQLARNSVTPPVSGVPYNNLGRQGTHDRQGRPTTLPPQVAMDAPSSQPPLLAPTQGLAMTDIVAAGRGRFTWPVRGAVLQGFNHTPNGQGNDGVNIAAKPGEAVRAAAAGEVVYAGDQVPSFGNLVLVKHPNGWVTAYAHMAGITVKNRDQVAQGQQIGVAGNTGNVGVTQLHFEMRYSPNVRDKAQPIDPMLILPGL